MSGAPHGSDFYDKILASDAEMYAVGHWDWEQFNRMVDLHLRFEQDDHERMTALPAQAD